MTPYADPGVNAWAREKQSLLGLTNPNESAGQCHPTARRQWHPTRGFTLIELLVVIGIMLALGAVMIPAMRPAMESRRIREAARQVNVYLGTARNRAIETGRPAGVIFVRDPNLPQACVTLQQAEVPPPYAGDWEQSRIISVQGSNPNEVVVAFPGMESPFDVPGNPNHLVHNGDRLQLNYQGPTWTILNITGPQAGPWQLTCSSTQTTQLPLCPIVGGQPSPLPFQFFRQPVASSTPAVTLPAQMAVDLVFSGSHTHPFGVGPPFVFDHSSPVVIMFSPNGSLDSFYLGGVRSHALEPIHLLIGRRDRVTLDLGPPYTPPAEDGRRNWQDTNNLWVTAFPQAGLVTTAQVRAASNFEECCGFAHEGQRMGGQ
jgi:prepilin-type N-terminal cleavage/methylation domain-containing protein